MARIAFIGLGNMGTGLAATYLLYLSYRERGDVMRVLVGDRAGSMH